MSAVQERKALVSIRRPNLGTVQRSDPRIVVHGAASSLTYIVVARKGDLRLALRPLFYDGWATDADGVRIKAPTQAYAGCRVHIEKDDEQGANDGARIKPEDAECFGLQGRMVNREGRYLTGFVQVPLGAYSYGINWKTASEKADAAEVLTAMVAKLIKQVGATPVASSREIQTFLSGYFAVGSY